MCQKPELRRNEDYPRISIITVCYNSEKFLERAINSITIQNYSNIEYIIVDGGSTDGTFDIIKRNERYIAKWISEPDQGIYDAMNKGIDMATGNYIAFLNSDDWYNEGVIEHVVEDLKRESASVFCYEANVVEENGIFLFRGKRKLEDIRFRMIHCHQAIIAKRSIFQEYGKFNTQYKIAADYDWLLRLYNSGASIIYDDYIMVNFRAGGASSIRASESQWEARSVALEALNSLKIERKISKEEYDTLYEKIEIFYMEAKWKRIFKEAIQERLFLKDDYLLSELKTELPDRKYSIFGCGVLGVECMNLLEQMGYDITCFWDNKSSNWGKKKKGYEIKSPEGIKSGNTLILVSSLKYENEINKQLNEMGLEKGVDFLNYSTVYKKIGKEISELRNERKD